VINSLHIKNFKSIKELKINPRKVNLFIGRPNVGKSNVLEAISMLNTKELICKPRKIDNLIVRYNSVGNLFLDRKKISSIESNLNRLQLKLTTNNSCEFEYEGKLTNSNNSENLDQKFTFKTDLNGSLNWDDDKFQKAIDVNVKLYKFRESSIKLRNISLFQSSLNFPFGENLLSVIESDSDLTKTLSDILKDYGLDLVFIEDDGKFVIQKSQNNRIVQLPFELIADTIKRYIFYIVAIKTNSESTLIFEEPESNSFPPYIVQLAENIAASNNQFFITTHSPYILETLFNRCDQSDIAIYHLEYENHETKVNQLESEAVKELIELKGDVFYNLDYFKNTNG